MRHLIVSVALLALAGCTSPIVIPTTKHDGHYLPTDAAKGAIYVYRESEFAMSGRGLRRGCGDDFPSVASPETPSGERVEDGRRNVSGAHPVGNYACPN